MHCWLRPILIHLYRLQSLLCQITLSIDRFRNTSIQITIWFTHCQQLQNDGTGEGGDGRGMGAIVLTWLCAHFQL